MLDEAEYSNSMLCITSKDNCKVDDDMSIPDIILGHLHLDIFMSTVMANRSHGTLNDGLLTEIKTIEN